MKLVVVRVMYGKASTPIDQREYKIQGMGGPVGTRSDWVDYASKQKHYHEVEFIELDRSKHKYPVFPSLILFLGLLVAHYSPVYASPTQTQASYYTEASCRREGTSGIMANGRRLDDNKLTCASWFYPFGTRLKVSTVEGKSVEVVVTDRGPSKRLVKKGRTIDLSKRAFDQLASLKQGIISVVVTPVLDGTR